MLNTVVTSVASATWKITAAHAATTISIIIAVIIIIWTTVITVITAISAIIILLMKTRSATHSTALPWRTAFGKTTATGIANATTNTSTAPTKIYK